MYRHFNITALNFISCYSKLSFVQPISLQDLFFPIYLPTTSAIYMINLLVKGNEKTPFRGGLSASLLFLYLADMQSLINFCGLNERGVCICRCYGNYGDTIISFISKRSSFIRENRVKSN